MTHSTSLRTLLSSPCPLMLSTRWLLYQGLRTSKSSHLGAIKSEDSKVWKTSASLWRSFGSLTTISRSLICSHVSPFTPFWSAITRSDRGMSSQSCRRCKTSKPSSLLATQSIMTSIPKRTQFLKLSRRSPRLKLLTPSWSLRLLDRLQKKWSEYYISLTR